MIKEIGISRRATGVAVALVCASVVSYGGNVAEILKLSDTVIIGTPTAINTQAQDTLFTLSVTSWLSPTPDGAPSSLSVVWRASLAHRQARTKAPGLGIWYLKYQGLGTYGPVAVSILPGVDALYQPAAARGSCPSALSYAPTAPLGDKIILELACAAALDNADYNSANNILGAFGVASSPAAQRAYIYLTQMSGSRQRSIGIGCLLAASETSAMQLLEQNLPQLSDQDLARIIAPALGDLWRSSDSAAIQSLGRIATGPRAQGMFLFEAASALQEIHTAETLPYLAKLLDSSDRGTQIRAHGGFVAFVSGLPIHTQSNSRSMEFMRSSPTPYFADQSWKSFAIQSMDPSNAELQAAASFWKGWLKAHPELPQAQ